MASAADPPPPYFCMGPGTYRVPMTMHADNRARLRERMVAAGHSTGVVLLAGGEQETRYDTDTDIVFRQESFFNWAFGVREPGFYGALDLATGAACLFLPTLPETYIVWCGEIKPAAYFRDHYRVEEAASFEDMEEWVMDRLAKARAKGGGVLAGALAKGAGARTWAGSSRQPIFVLHGVNSDSGKETKTTAMLPWMVDRPDVASVVVDRVTLHPIISDVRVYKSADELALMRHVSAVTSMAHVECMRGVRAGMPEYQLESLFQHHTYTHGGCRHQAYTCICACGPNSATLHYGHAGAPNERVLLETDIALLDMGAEYHCYCSDITCSFPVSGTFTADQRDIYNAVLDAQRVVMAAMRPGINWANCHRLATRSLIASLARIGVLRGDPAKAKDVDALLAAGLGPVFMPCGLGHFIGLDCHDVGGYLDGHPESRLQAAWADNNNTTLRRPEANLPSLPGY